MKILTRYFLMSLLLLLSCSSINSGSYSARQLAKLDGSWLLTELLGNGNLEKIYVEQNPFITFSLEEGKVKGNSGCNSFFGKVEISNSEIDIKELGSTKRFCSDVPESEFFDALEKVSTYKISGEMLEMRSGEKSLLKFKRMID